MPEIRHDGLCSFTRTRLYASGCTRTIEVELVALRPSAVFRERIRALIDPDDDRIRLYHLANDFLIHRRVRDSRYTSK
jgi:hypothetical protein